MAGRTGTRPAGVCKDCAGGSGKPRPAPYPGPRCATHHRAFRRAQKDRSRDNRVVRVYGLPPGAYEALKAAQGGVCAGCGPRTGRNGSRGRALAVDHNHRCDAGHPPELGCVRCVRGLLCSTCNQAVGDFRDDPMTLLRLALYLINPPAREVLDRFHTGGGGTDECMPYTDGHDVS